MDYSVDDGASWRPAQGLFGPDGTGMVTITHPSANGYVSLRVHAEDSVGSAVDETIVHAYAVGAGP